ncbi:hypothetical protein B296_00004158 [Ensete ventricosum]|uniref:CN hydrolase domain-containing protein n=1 Tax=Ensete ventricosum TaxID=4639 RepID=A0A427AKZ8_ENSVE|nr:hypothetical protein B296_00004158 [Ensete ventricosum]
MVLLVVCVHMWVPASLTWTSLAIWYTRRVIPQLQVVAAAQAGRHNERRESYGDSLIIDPWGIVIARLPGDTQVFYICKLVRIM